MDKLWAPWRMLYIRKENDGKCIFCDIDEEMLIAKGKGYIIMLNRYPYNNGHIMAAPLVHDKMLDELSEEEMADYMKGVQKAIKIVRKVYNPDGVNVGFNIGQSAGAGITDHLHMHIVPRWNGDTNFMPLFAETKIISESLEESKKQLVEAYKEIS